MDLRPGYKQTEIGEIPVDWDQTTVGAEFEIQLGKMLDAVKNVGVEKPYLGNKAVQWGRVVLDDIGTIKLTPSDLQRFRLRYGDLLVCEGGEVGRAALWEAPLAECYYQKALHRLRPKKHYNVRFLLAVLEQWSANGVFRNFVTQTSIAHLPKDKFEVVPIPLPPKYEQEAIAEALSDADALIESLEQLIAKKRQIKQGAMQELLTGKRRLPGFETKPGTKQTNVGPVPADWDLVPVRDLTLRHKQGFYTTDRYVENGTRLVRITDLMSSRIDFPSMPMLHVTPGEFEQFKISRGDFLFARSGAIGRYGIVNEDTPAIFGSYIIRFVFNTQRISNEFFGCLYETDLVWRQLMAITQGSSNININAENIKSLKVPVPPLPEQSSIARIFIDMDQEREVLETKLEKARHIKQGMMHSLLTGRIRLV